MESNGELDRLIDSALAGYSSAQPLAGLEERVLNRVRLTDSARRRVLGWAVTIAVGASVVVAAIFLRIPHAPSPAMHDTAGIQTAAPPQSVPEELRVAPKRCRVRIETRRAERGRPLPKLEQFPSPTPMTAEEQALRSFVERYPVGAQQAFAQLHKWSNEPVEIEPIQIPPIQINAP